MKKVFISPNALKILRERKGWSRKRLAEQSGMSDRQIASYETSKETKTSLNQTSLKKLAKALGERDEVLSGEKDIPSEPRDTNINIKLHPQTRLNYDLLEKRYGIKIEEAVNAAPLLIVEAAEKSLIAFNERIDRDENKIGEAYQLLRVLGKESEFDPNVALPGFSYEDVDDVPGTLSAMRDSILAKDIFGSGFPEIFDLGDPRYRANPFASYLAELSSSLPNTDVEEDHFGFLHAFPGTRIPILRVCMDILREITLGSQQALQALSLGIASIHEIPEDLWGAHNASDRVKWLEEKYNAASESDEG